MEDAKIILSIIVPIYNVERYLKKCIDSLLNQDISNYEIILVDDGSLDACPQICDDYAEHYTLNITHSTPTIKVIHRENGGLSAARNSGIEVANGEYVMFVDSDDYIEPNVLDRLIAQMERDDLDVLRYKYQNVNERYEVFQPYKRDHRLENDYSDIPTDGVSFLNSRMNTQCYAWQFILKRDLINSNQSSAVSDQSLGETNILFTPGIYFEDTDWTPRMLARARRVASTETVVYNYLMREGSITNAVTRSKQKKVLDDKMRLIGTLQQQAIELKKSGRYTRWYGDMISDTVVSIIGILSVNFYEEKDTYLAQLQELQIYPLAKKSFKARLINFSPMLVVKLLHLKNR